ncbi:MAG: putative toxin-antitoxin system antitoxin component (TIGR02293 family) [Saprospiraceae bacterium]|jgi:putative toxin-antitoxin system antitoxin component (TIGR02293 family)|tara:strand:+ start:895 stop:1389 length:495 start_codon:yes stop_codon:yes gene_type:complete
MKDETRKYKIEDEAINTSVNEAAIFYKSLPSPLKVIGNVGRDDKHTFLSVVKDGLDYDTLIDFMEMAEFHLDEMAIILHINSRTIRRLDSKVTLNIDLSEKLLELMRLYKFGIEIFGDMAVFNVWIRRSIRGLGDVTPMSLLDTGIGVEIVMDELERLAYGVYN